MRVASPFIGVAHEGMLLGLLSTDERAQNILRASFGAPYDFVFFDFCHIIKIVERAEE
jgi:hypothetical protein